MRIRTIKPEFWRDEKLAPCDVLTRLVFLGLISMADDAGRVVDNIKVLDAFIFPETSETCRGAVGELAAMGRIRRGVTASGQRVIQIVKWEAHQKIEKRNLKAALPPIVEEVVDTPAVTSVPRLVVDDSPTSRGGVGEESSNHTNDQRPTTDDLRPTTNDHSASRCAPAAPKAKASRGAGAAWLGAFRRAHEDRYGAGSFTPALAARFVKSWGGIVAAHGEEAAAKTWHHANRPTNPELKWVTPERVAAQYNDHDPDRLVAL
jgi:hypothetical protein